MTDSPPPASLDGQDPSSGTGRRAVVSPWAAPGERARKRQNKRDAVLRAAAQMFNERGFHATSMDDIAASLNVSKPTLYYYFKNKDQILLEAVRLGFRMTHDGIEASRAAGGNALEQLAACMRAYARVVTMDFGMCLIRVGDEQMPPDSRKELRRQKAAIDKTFRNLVAESVQAGLIAPCDPKIVAFTIAGALSWIAKWYQPEGRYSAEEVVEQSVRMLIDGLLPR